MENQFEQAPRKAKSTSEIRGARHRDRTPPRASSRGPNSRTVARPATKPLTRLVQGACRAPATVGSPRSSASKDGSRDRRHPRALESDVRERRHQQFQNATMALRRSGTIAPSLFFSSTAETNAFRRHSTISRQCRPDRATPDANATSTKSSHPRPHLPRDFVHQPVVRNRLRAEGVARGSRRLRLRLSAGSPQIGSRAASRIQPKSD
jgi:hypothetical protein